MKTDGPTNSLRAVRRQSLVISLTWAIMTGLSLIGPTNGQAQPTIDKDGALKCATKAGEVIFRPQLTVIRLADELQFAIKPIDGSTFGVASWKSASPSTKNQHNAFEIGTVLTFDATGFERTSPTSVRWRFAEQEGVNVEADVDFSSEYPKLTMSMTVEKAGRYSLGYTGAPIAPVDKATAWWLPMIWDGRLLPPVGAMVPDAACPIPTALLTIDGVTSAVAADPSTLRFEMVRVRDGESGVMIRAADGGLQTQLFAPVPGGKGSQMDAGQRRSFAVRLCAISGDYHAAFVELAQRLYGVSDYRQNVGISLNQTLANMVEFAMDDLSSGWREEYKAPDYATDVGGTVKLVSALHPVGAALTLHDRTILRRRALPMIEYLLSREKFLFAYNGRRGGQGASPALKGPTGEPFEWASLHRMIGRRNPVFATIAGEIARQPARALNLGTVAKHDDWVRNLALSRTFSSPDDLRQAAADADDYVARFIDRLPEDFGYLEKEAQFWTDFAPRWIQLFELYLDTGNRRFLDAAATGARRYARCCWMTPAPPSQSPEHWRASPIGLTAEATTTFDENKAILLSHHAPWMLRIAELTNDDFLRTVARHAVIGRYDSYPGYKVRSTTFTKNLSADWPIVPKDRDRPFFRKDGIQLYYNHVWPHIALLIDYLVSDAWASSDGAIDFPGEYAQGYVYLQSRVYGHRPGKFYDIDGVYPTLAADFVKVDNPQINWIGGLAGNRSCVALMNQSDAPANVTVTLPTGTTGDHARHWRDNQPAADLAIKEGTVTVTVSPHGISALAVSCAPTTALAQSLFADRALIAKLGNRRATFTIGADKGHVYLLDLGDDLVRAYVYVETKFGGAKSATFIATDSNGKTSRVTDAIWPFEASVPLSAAVGGVQFEVQITDSKDQTQGATVKVSF